MFNINAPTTLPDFGVFITHLQTIITHHLNSESLSDLEKKYFELIYQDTSSLDERKLSQNNTQKQSKIYGSSHFYYLMIQVDDFHWGNCLQRCCVVFLDQLIKHELNSNINYHFGVTNQSAVRRFLTVGQISGTCCNVFEIYHNIDNGNSINPVETFLNELKKINSKGKTSKVFQQSLIIFTNIVNNYVAGNINTYKKPFQAPSGEKPSTPVKLFLTSKVIKQTDVSFIDLTDGEPITRNILEVKNLVNEATISAGELAKWSRTRLSLKNHFPQNHNHVLNDYEAVALYNFLLNDHKKHGEDIVRFSVLLMLILGLDVSWLKYIKIVELLPEDPAPFHVYISPQGLCKFGTLPLKKPYQINKTQTQWLSGEHTKSITISLPKTLTGSICLFAYEKLDSIKNKEDINRLFEKIRHHLGRRFTQNRVRDFSFNLLYRATKDEVLCSYLQPISNYVMPTGCYYTSISTVNAVKLHEKSFTPIFGKLVENNVISKSDYIGSEVNINMSEIKLWLGRLKDKVNLSKQYTRHLADLIAFHNNYAKYVTTLLLITTGHRSVNDLFENRNFIFIEDGLCFIGDKASSKEGSLRVVPLCAVAIEQLTLYIRHLDSMAFRVSKFDNILAKKISYTSKVTNDHFCPLLFEIQGDKIQGFNGQMLHEFWGAEFTLPDNFNRHLLSTQLCEYGTNREFINYLLGHSAAGQNPLSSTSTLHVSSWHNVISDMIDLILAPLELTALDGLKKGKKHKCIEIALPPENIITYGVKLRQKNIQAKEHKIKIEVTRFFEEKFKHLLTFHKYSPLLNSDVEIIKSYIDNLPKYKQGKAYTICQKIISKYHRKLNKKPPVIWFVEKGDSSGILPINLPNDLQKAKIISARLESLVVKSLTCIKSSFTDKVALSYIYALTDNLNTKMTTKDYLTLLRQDIKKTNEAIYLENNLVNWFPNTLMLLSIVNLKKQWPAVSPTLKNLSNSIKRLLNELSNHVSLDNLTLNKFNQLFCHYNSIFNYSPAENQQQQAKKLYSFSKSNYKNSDKKPKIKTDSPKLITPEFQDTLKSTDIHTLVDKLKNLGNVISNRNMKRLDQRQELTNILKEFMSSKYELTYVIASWGMHMLLNGTRKKTNPAVSTLITYLTVNTTSINELLDGGELLKMTDDQISYLLEEVVEFNGASKHVLSAMLNFSDFLASAAGKTNILISNYSWSSEQVDINYFSKNEIALILKTDWSEEDRLYLTLLIETGCRPSEAYGLLIDDIDTVGQSIQFRTNSLSRKKNEFSIRPFIFEKLSASLIDKLLVIKKERENTMPLFDVNYKTNGQLNYKLFCLQLNMKIKNILNRSVSIKHFRHTFARQAFLKNKNISLRSVWQNAADLGHASPVASQFNYIHDVYQKNRHMEIDDTTLSKALKIKESTIRKQRERIGSGLPPKIANSYLFLKNVQFSEN